MCVLVLYACVCVCVHVFLTSLLRHSSRESGVKRKSGPHSAGIHGSGPRGSVRGSSVHRQSLSSRTQTHSHRKERRGGDKVTRGEKAEKGVMGDALWGRMQV